MRDPSGEHDDVADAEPLAQLAQPHLLRTAAGKQHRKIGVTLTQRGQGLQQQVQTFVEVERAEEGENNLSGKTQSFSERAVRSAGPGEGRAVDRVGDDGDLFSRDAAGG